MDMGPCPKVHSLQLRKEYEEAKAKAIDNYERDLEDVIDRLILECDRKITRALRRLEAEDAKAAIAISVSEVTQTPEVLELSKQIKEKLKEADQYDLEGKTDLKIRALEVVEELRTKRADKQSMLLLDAFNKDRASLPQPLPNPPPLAPLPVITPDPRTQEMINEKLKKAEDLATENRFSGKSFPFDQNLHLLTRKSFYILILPSNHFRSTRKREKHTQPKRNKTQEANKRSEREREQSRPRKRTNPEPEPFDFAFTPIAVRIAPFVVPDRRSNHTLRRPRSRTQIRRPRSPQSQHRFFVPDRDGRTPKPIVLDPKTDRPPSLPSSLNLTGI
uniref:RNA-binding protein Luc7-like 1 n=1 Tax=Quercus lobata TaxID=97700 RepID=A0A7N2KQP5_QUELO